MKIDFVKLLKNYKSGWVAISADFKKVVFTGKTLKETMKKAQKTKEKVYYFPVEKTYSNFVG
jgi:predicted RNase H-like HicB family nuclease